MPEGHTLHRYARDHHGWFAGKQVRVKSPQGRFAQGAALLDGRQFVSARAWGKHLFYVFDGDGSEARNVHIHLGLFGRFRRYAGEEPEPRGAIRLRIVHPERTLDLHGPTRCECLTDRQVREQLAKLGPDPLREECTAEAFLANLQRTRRGIGQVLMDQSMVAGIGNVYRAELLLEHRLNPFVPAREVDPDVARALWDTSRRWLQLGVRLNRIVTADPKEVGRPPSRMRRGERVRIYKRPVCAVCGGRTRVEDLAGRKLYWCPACQA